MKKNKSNKNTKHAQIEIKYKNNTRNQQSISNLYTFSSVHCQKENYSNETKIFSNIKFKVLGSWAYNKIIYVIQLSDRVYNVTFPAKDLYSPRHSRREYIS